MPQHGYCMGNISVQMQRQLREAVDKIHAYMDNTTWPLGTNMEASKKQYMAEKN